MTAYFSEFGEDKWIDEHLRLPDQGFFIDIGSAHAGAGSNTTFLALRGWGGLAVDANPAYAPTWQTFDRVAFVAGLVSNRPIVPFEFRQIAGHSRVKAGATRFATTSIDRLLGAYPIRPAIDFLSLDVEGHEFEALCSLNLSGQGFGNGYPEVIVSEYNTEGIGEDFRVSGLLLSLGYRVVHQTIANLVFTR